MALQKQSLLINFGQGLDLKTDPKQVSPGKFLALENSIFTKGGLLQKRNGNKQLTSLLDPTANYLTTFNGNLTALGSTLEAYSTGAASWATKGSITPAQLETIPLIRSGTNQSQADAAVAPNGLVCTVFTDDVPVSGSIVKQYKYAIADSVTGQNIVAPTVITPMSGAVTNSPRVFIVGTKFVIVFSTLVSATNHIEYQAVSYVTPTSVSYGDISASYTPASQPNYDGVVVNNTLYLAWGGGAGDVKMAFLNSTLQQSNTVSFTTQVATHITLAADTTSATPTIYVSYYNSATSVGRTLAVDSSLNTVLAPATMITAESVSNLASTAESGILTLVYEVNGVYAYDTSLKTHYLKTRTITRSGTTGSAAVTVRSVGLASKAILYQGTPYYLTVYDSPFQPTYFLMDGSGKIVAKIAYSNGGGYETHGLQGISLNGNSLQFAYFYKDLIAAVNKSQGVANTAGVYAQLGINLGTVTLESASMVSSEIANNLDVSGGILWAYDGYQVVEQGFHLYPDYVQAVPSVDPGDMTAQDYFYQVTYEWSDNQGNIFRSAPSIPVKVTLTTETSVEMALPTLRLTYKTQNPVKVVVYRWSTAQQIYYQVTSVQIPLLNDTTVDYLDFSDTLSDADILGNSILYTTGGVIENIGPPATSAITLFQSRQWLVDAEDRNLLWFSKQVIEATPVEFSDLLTIYVAPTAAAQGSTGPITALSAMDDKLIVFKENAIYYINGVGPDNTGANNQFSEPVFITSTVGCTNQHSIVFMPQGLMFQSDKGIWLLGRDLSTTYVGSAVENYNTDNVLSSVNVPATNQVRFVLDSGVTLMYDYFYGQWGTFTGIPGISSCLFEGVQAFINSRGEVYQENPGSYLDGSRPVTMKFTTGWLNLAGLQGFERAYFFYILGTYFSPHKLSLSIAYDYDPSPAQTSVITPDNYTQPWGGEQLWGNGTPYGGGGDTEQWRIFLARQKCQAFQVTLQESFDPSYGTVAGQGLTLSGMDLIVGIKGSYPRLRASRSVG